MKKIALSMALILSATIAFGQALSKAEIKAQKRQAKALMVVAKDAEKLITENPAAALDNVKACIESPLVNNDPYVWFIAAKSRKAIVEKENAARAAGTQIDMDKFYSNCSRLIFELEKCDSLDNAPDAKGKVAPKYAEFIKEGLYENRNQMYNGGSFYYNKGNYAESYNQFAKFITLTDHHLLKDAITPAEKVYNVNAAYNAVLCGMRLEDYAKVLEFADIALADESKAGNIYRYKASAYEALGDTVKWVELLKDGVVKFPEDPFFYQTLIQHYDKAGDSSQLDKLADELIASNPANPLFVYLKGYIAQQKNDMDTAMEWYKKTLEIDPSYVNALHVIALYYSVQAQDYAEKQASVNFNREQIKKDKEIISGYYKMALPYYEKLRELAPDKKELWLSGLSNCYYNLNMQDKLKEIESLAQ